MEAGVSLEMRERKVPYEESEIQQLAQPGEGHVAVLNSLHGAMYDYSPIATRLCQSLWEGIA